MSEFPKQQPNYSKKSRNICRPIAFKSVLCDSI